MRSIVFAAAGAAVFGLGACSETAQDGETTPAEADAEAGGTTVAADAAGAGSAQAGDDVRGTTGTAPPDGAGKPGTTLPTVPPDSDEATNASTPTSSSN